LIRYARSTLNLPTGEAPHGRTQESSKDRKEIRAEACKEGCQEEGRSKVDSEGRQEEEVFEEEHRSEDDTQGSAKIRGQAGEEKGPRKEEGDPIEAGSRFVWRPRSHERSDRVEATPRPSGDVGRGVRIRRSESHQPGARRDISTTVALENLFSIPGPGGPGE
jgi:hypothetical protein